MSSTPPPATPDPDAAPALSRRRVLGTAAWAVPVVTLASAAPAFAASGDQVSLSLNDAAWGTDDAYLYVLLDVENRSLTTSATSVQVLLTLDGRWKDGVLVDVDPYGGGLSGDFGTGWTAASTSQTLNGTATRLFTLPSLAPGATSTLGFRVRRQGLSSRTPYGEAVGVAITSVGPDFTVATDSITGFTSPATSSSGFSINGVCGLLGAVGPGFVLQAGDRDLPAGTSVDITLTGIAINVIPVVVDASGAEVPTLASVQVLGTGEWRIVLDQPLPAGAQLQIRYTASLGVGAVSEAVVSLPAGHTVRPDDKTTGRLTQVAVVGCSGS